MTEKTVKVINENGMHMRPSMMLTDRAAEFESDITMEKDGTEVNAKSIMHLTMLAATCGQEVTIRAEGPDEEEAVEALAAIIEEGFSEVYVEE